MPIHKGILKRHAEKYVIVMDGGQTLGDFQQQFQELNYPLNDTFLVVALSDNQYRVEHIFNLDDTLVDRWTQPLSTLTLSPASRVIHVNTSETGKSIVDWVTNTPNSTLVVIDDNGFVGLIANIDMKGGSRDNGIGILGKLSGKKNKRSSVGDSTPKGERRRK